MKKILFAFVLFAIANYGGINLNARAATLTPDQITALEQQIETMRATALALSSAAAAAPASQDAAPPVMVTLSPREAAEINAALDALKTVLITIQAQFGTDPNLAGQNLSIAVESLQSIGSTLAAIIGTLSAPYGPAIASVPAPARVPAPTSAPAQAGSKPVAQAAPSAPSAPSDANAPLNAPAAGSVIAPAANTETAEVASAGSWKNLNWPPIAVMLLMVLTAGLWLFWPEGKESAKGKGYQKFTAPPPSVLVSTASQSRPTVVVTPVKQSGAPQTPLATVMSASVQDQKPPLRPQQPQQLQQQRKPA